MVDLPKPRPLTAFFQRFVRLEARKWGLFPALAVVGLAQFQKFDTGFFNTTPFWHSLCYARVLF